MMHDCMGAEGLKRSGVEGFKRVHLWLLKGETLDV